MSMDRATLLAASATLTGIDFVQVSASQTELTLFLHHETLPAGLAATLAALPADAFSITADGQVAPSRVAVVQHVNPLPPPVDGRAVLRILVAEPGGFGWYRLAINSPSIDPYFNNIVFSFKAGCDSDLDCAPQPRPCPADAEVDFPVDYRARDFGSYRQALMDFAAQRYPDWQDRLEADIGMMILELIAATGDEFAYAQDRIARESRLEQASQRRSLRHLARLVDYEIGNGSGAFAWIDVEAGAPANVPAGLPISDAAGQLVFEIGWGLRDRPLGVPPAPAPAPTVYAIHPARNALAPYIWDEDNTCLLAGSTSLTLRGAHAVRLQPDAAIDPAGRWVLLRTDPNGQDRPARRLAVRITSAVDDVDPLPAAAPAITRIRFDPPLPHDLDLETLTVRGNLLPATSGKLHVQRFRIGPASDPADPDAGLPQAIERVGPGSTLCYPEPGSDADRAAQVKILFPLAGSDVTPLVWHRHDQALRPEVELVMEGDRRWPWRPALVGETTAEATDRLFTLEDGLYRRVVGFERAGTITELVDYASSEGSTIRFGCNGFGLSPPEGAIFTVRYRLGNGRRTNAAADTLVVPGMAVLGVVRLSNPLPATGGSDPELLADVRTHAPQAFRATTYSAVRAIDHARMAERVEGVQKAGATSRWTGSWPTIFVTPDPAGTTVLTPALRGALAAQLDRVRQAGREVKLRDPRYADIDLEITLCVAADAHRGAVKEAALLALFDKGGFFDPDNFTFGTPLSRAALIAALQAVPGVKAVEAMRVRHPGHFDWRAFSEYALPVGLDELVRVANDRLLMERGAVRLLMEGGA
jgi:hypothetical protein